VISRTVEKLKDECGYVSLYIDVMVHSDRVIWGLPRVIRSYKSAKLRKLIVLSIIKTFGPAAALSAVFSRNNCHQIRPSTAIIHFLQRILWNLTTEKQNICNMPIIQQYIICEEFTSYAVLL
jgi:hypothetical protein